MRLHSSPISSRQSVRQFLIQIAPVGIHFKNESNLPRARPMLHCLLALDRRANAVVRFVPDKALETIELCEASDAAFTVLEGAARKIVGDAEIERPVWPISLDVNPAAAHQRMVRVVEA